MVKNPKRHPIKTVPCQQNKKFLDIWYSPAYKDFRKRHYSGKLESVCAVCDVPLKQNGLKWWQSL